MRVLGRRCSLGVFVGALTLCLANPASAEPHGVPGSGSQTASARRNPGPSEAQMVTALGIAGLAVTSAYSLRRKAGHQS